MNQKECKLCGFTHGGVNCFDAGRHFERKKQEAAPSSTYNNTTSTHPTHFLKGTELITGARNAFNVPSENWTYPTKHRFGIPRDKYYAEVWVDGMDWQCSFWLIETFNYDNPVCQPFLIFEDSKNYDNFNDHDFEELIKAALYERRDQLWIQKDDGFFNDTVWTYLKRVQPDNRMMSTPCMVLFQFEHASQKRVQFYMNEDMLPPYPRFQR